MKKTLFLLSIFISTLMTAQDGLSGWVDTDSVDTFISIYNASTDTKSDIFDHYAEYISIGDLTTGKFTITINNTIVYGETFITISSTNHVLYDIYVDKILYHDGSTYLSTRHKKPNTDCHNKK